MSEGERDTGRAWLVHGVALALWACLYLYLFWDALFPATKPALDLAGFGAALAGVSLAIYAAIVTVVMVFVGRRPAVPLVLHGLAFSAWAVGAYVERQDERARAAEEERARERQEKERQPEGCLHARTVRAQDGRPRRAEIALTNGCDSGVVVGDETLVGFDRAGGNDILDRWQQPPAAVPRGQTATLAVEGHGLQGGDPAIPLATWAWKINLEVEAPRVTMLCFATAGAPDSSRCAAIEAVEVAPAP